MRVGRTSARRAMEAMTPELWIAALCIVNFDCSKSTTVSKNEYSHYMTDTSSGALVNRINYSIQNDRNYRLNYYDLFKPQLTRPTQRGRMPWWLTTKNGRKMRSAGFTIGSIPKNRVITGINLTASSRIILKTSSKSMRRNDGWNWPKRSMD